MEQVLALALAELTQHSQTGKAALKGGVKDLCSLTESCPGLAEWLSSLSQICEACLVSQGGLGWQ